MAAHPLGVIDSEEEIRARTETWRPLAAKAAEEAGLPVDLLLALVATESSGRPRASSSAGALGLTQLMPRTAVETAALHGFSDPESVDLLDPAVNLRLGAAFLADQIRSFDGDTALGLAAYIQGRKGPAEWRRADSRRSGIEVVRTFAPSVTRAYVERVLARRRWFAERKPPAALPSPGGGSPGLAPAPPRGLATGTVGG
jgi:soluble lytic murein transglycosylase